MQFLNRCQDLSEFNISPNDGQIMSLFANRAMPLQVLDARLEGNPSNVNEGSGGAKPLPSLNSRSVSA